MSECKATWWRACKFKPRMERRISDELAKGVRKLSNATLDELLGVDVYVRDVCERCGKTIEREKAK